MKNKSHQSGYTMLEAIMYIALVISVVIVFMSVVNKMWGRYKISRMTSQVTEIAKAISDRCVASASYAECIGGTISAKMGKFLCDQNLQPKDMSCTSDGHLRYRNVEVVFTDWGDFSLGRKVPRGQYYMMVFTNLTKQECVELATYDFGDSPYIDLDSMHIGPATAEPDNAFRWPVDAYTIGEKRREMPIAPALAAEWCEEVCEGSNPRCMVHWTFN